MSGCGSLVKPRRLVTAKMVIVGVMHGGGRESTQLEAALFLHWIRIRSRSSCCAQFVLSPSVVFYEFYVIMEEAPKQISNMTPMGVAAAFAQAPLSSFLKVHVGRMKFLQILGKITTTSASHAFVLEKDGSGQ